MTTSQPAVPIADSHLDEAPSRRARLLAAAIDGTALVAFEGVAFLVAVAWLLVRTEWGAIDVRDGDAVVAASLLAAAPAAWAAWIALEATRGATPGERRARLHVTSTPRRALLRQATRPLAGLAWGWLALFVLVVLGPWPALVLLVVAGLVLLAGLASMVLWLARPEAPALHDRLAGTRLVIDLEGGS
ncbi:MAG: RDD family protein [Dehalococcoidia bacterium]